MATKIPPEILIKILNNVPSTKDLHSSLLVNRIWCKVTAPILWELPLDQEFRWMSYKKLEEKVLCIRTYISCMDTQTRTLLIQNGFDLSSSPPQSIFDYPSFARKFRIDNLAYFIYKYSQKIIVSNQDSNYKNNSDKLRILFHEIYKLIINRCTFLDSFKMTKISFGNFLNGDLIGSINNLPGALKAFKKVETFVSATTNSKLIRPLYKSLALICDNILNMNLEFKSESQVLLLENLISAQKRLEDLSITDYGYINSNSLLWAIFSQKETLKILRLKSVRFYEFKRKLSPIGQFTSLQELYIENCYGLHQLDCSVFASSFTQLNSFHYFHQSQLNGYPQEFIIKILETANINLKNICLDMCLGIPSDILSVILNYCKKITQLTLLNLSPEQVIAIFNNNFNELRRFSFGHEKRMADELLCQIGKNVPKSLETIEIRMGIFSADSLRKFFEGWCRKGEGRNKKIIVKHHVPQLTLSAKHWKVIKEYGVQIDIE